MDINFEYYKVFYYVARLQSVTLAAKALFITQPAVSKSIARLEESLNCRLFNRTRKMELTTEGAALYAHISKAFQHIITGVEELEDMTKLNRGEVCIGAVHMFIRYFLMPYLEVYHNKYPNIAIKFNNSDMRGTAAALRSGKIDFGIVTKPVDRPDDFDVITVGSVRDVFIAGERFSQLKDKEMTLEELSRYPIICLKSGMITRHYTDAIFLEKNIILKPVFEMEMLDIMVPLSEIGLGISLVNDIVAKAHKASGRVFEVKLTEPLPSRDICIIKNKGDHLSAAAAAFIDELHNFKL